MVGSTFFLDWGDGEMGRWGEEKFLPVVGMTGGRK